MFHNFALYNQVVWYIHAGLDIASDGNIERIRGARWTGVRQLMATLEYDKDLVNEGLQLKQRVCRWL